ncbi:TM2 domain-containing protein [Rothia sp. AR01]|uniref:TM2 domain-containing protein n=1 Tax=Rothia santali TaxID=2949643 RepID=A0A9X2KJ95_9MICC|nr:TM2 domain-containing protein [Rothia santali]MCP3426865.1 TM2 domain-containing protein [Rothia santali]
MSHEEPEHYTPRYFDGARRGGPGAAGPADSAYARPVYIRPKSMLIAYLLWLFLGIFGVHKLYLAQPIQFVFYLILHGLGWLLSAIFIGYLFFGVLALLLLIDIVAIPLRVGTLNARMARRAY